MSKSKNIIVITGAGGSLGEALVSVYLQQSHLVLAIVRDRKRAPLLMREQSNPLLHVLEMDINDEGAAQLLVTQLEAFIVSGCNVDAIIFNAAVHVSASVEELTLSSARAVIETNFFAVLIFVQAVLPMLRRQGSGKLLAVSSLSAQIGLPYDSIYAASKAALERLFESLQLELKPFGVEVGLIVPSVFASNLLSATTSEKTLECYEGLRECLQQASGSDAIPASELAAKIAVDTHKSWPSVSLVGDVAAERVLDQLLVGSSQYRSQLAQQWSGTKNWAQLGFSSCPQNDCDSN